MSCYTPLKSHHYGLQSHPLHNQKHIQWVCRSTLTVDNISSEHREKHYSSQPELKGDLRDCVFKILNAGFFFFFAVSLRMILTTKLTAVRWVLHHTRTRHLIISVRAASAQHTLRRGELNAAEHEIQPHYVVSVRKKERDFQSKAYLNGSLMMLKFHWGPARGTEWIQGKIKSFTDPIHLTWVISLSDEICAYDVCKLFYLKDKLRRAASNFLTSYVTLKHKNGTAWGRIKVLPQEWEIRHDNIDTISNRCDVPKSYLLLSHCNWSIMFLCCHRWSTWEKDLNNTDTGEDIISSVWLMFGLFSTKPSLPKQNQIFVLPWVNQVLLLP